MTLKNIWLLSLLFIVSLMNFEIVSVENVDLLELTEAEEEMFLQVKDLQEKNKKSTERACKK